MTRRSSGSTDDGDSSIVDSDNVDTEPESRPVVGLKSRPVSTRKTRRPSNLDWNHANPNAAALASNGRVDVKSVAPVASSQSPTLPASASGMGHAKKNPPPRPRSHAHRARLGSWSISLLALLTAGLGLVLLAGIVHSLLTRQQEPKGCRMSYMRPSYIRFSEFDTEHTRFATKYSLYLYREQGLDDEDQLRGTPVLFIPGNAGSYKQVRPIAAEAANYFYNTLQHDGASVKAGVRNLDFFTVDFNEDITAFHGQTLLDQAEYLNEAIRYILSLYSDPQRARRDSSLPDPTSVIIMGHSMGGVVARTMLVQPNYQANSINTILTMSAPHARPPVTFDGQIVQIYDEINEYWRAAYSQKWASNNPLWHVTLVSIAGGTLDTVVPSDYASLDSLVPETHGFTVFTAGIPTVWTSADHQAIMWCDQFRKVVSRALFDVVDVHRAGQTKPRADRMRTFRRRFLPGLEPSAEKSIRQGPPNVLLTLDDEASNMMSSDERLILPQLGANPQPKVHLLAIPPQESPAHKRFSLMSSTALSDIGQAGRLEVLLCSVFPSQSSASAAQFTSAMDLSGPKGAATRLACKNAAADAVLLPASTTSTKHPFYRDGEQQVVPMSHLRYDVEQLAEYQFVAIVDKSETETKDFVIAEFSYKSQYERRFDVPLGQLLAFGLSFELPAQRSTAVDVQIPAMKSGLFAYRLQVQAGACSPKRRPLFAPMARLYLDMPSESRFYVNVTEADISLHGVAPYMPPPLEAKPEAGAALEFFSDPSCESPVQVRITFDPFGSLGKLYMRYRTVFAAFPLLIVTLVLRKQFRVYDSTGIFISFSESLDLCLRQSIPLLLLSLTLLAASIAVVPQIDAGSRKTESPELASLMTDFHRNDLLIGTDDPLFTFLVPLIGIICIGVCAALHYVVLAMTHGFGLLYSFIRRPAASETGTEATPMFVPSTPGRRMISTAILLFLVATFIPYQFAYLVACLVQLFTAVRALRISTVTQSASNYNYYHYTHSILLLMMWVLPINLPILAVWIRNLAVHWLTPFSSHHNVLSIMPFILLVENMTTGRMVPQISSRLRHVTSILLFATAICAAVYGISHAYLLHYLVNIVATWLVILHSTSTLWSLANITAMFEGNASESREETKAP